ncbi:hypothetical protein [Microvirga sp. M2]|uniref:hypothetical protein n=1 Tax=Microvirga sp. M2 TaxID=3073270 RepID=UPI0039C36AA2
MLQNQPNPTTKAPKATRDSTSSHHALDAAEEQFRESCPEKPAELHVQKMDWILNMPHMPGDTFEMEKDGKRILVYTQEAVEKLRSAPRTMQDWSNCTGDNETGVRAGRKPDPKAQARADGIVAAWDRYYDAVQDARAQSGYAEARETVAELVEALRDLDERVARTRAYTLHGMLVKAKMVVDDPAYEGIEDQIENALQARESTGHFMGLSLVRDILHMNQGKA